MPNRYLRWNDPEFVHYDPDGEPCEGDCITLVDDYGSLSATSMTWPRSAWESLAEHILGERDRRAAEPREVYWYVSLRPDGEVRVAELVVIEHCKLPTAPLHGVVRGYDDGEMAFYILAEDEREARLKANEAAHSLRVWIREYLPQ